MKRFLLLVPVAVVLLLAAVPVLSWKIGHDVHAAAGAAVGEFGGHPVIALQHVACDEARPLRERNRAVWALGQLGDPSALPALESLATGEECRHDEYVCQRGVQKAIAGCRGAPNVTAVFWRHDKRHGEGRP